MEFLKKKPQIFRLRCFKEKRKILQKNADDSGGKQQWMVSKLSAEDEELEEEKTERTELVKCEQSLKQKKAGRYSQAMLSCNIFYYFFGGRTPFEKHSFLLAYV